MGKLRLPSTNDENYIVLVDNLVATTYPMLVCRRCFIRQANRDLGRDQKIARVWCIRYELNF